MDERASTKRISSVRDLDVYRVAFETAMEIYITSKGFPSDERYSLTDQIDPKVFPCGVC
jgi:23S rRNA-intervening sequence protein